MGIHDWSWLIMISDLAMLCCYCGITLLLVDQPHIFLLYSHCHRFHRWLYPYFDCLMFCWPYKNVQRFCLYDCCWLYIQYVSVTDHWPGIARMFPDESPMFVGEILPMSLIFFGVTFQNRDSSCPKFAWIQFDQWTHNCGSVLLVGCRGFPLGHSLS